MASARRCASRRCQGHRRFARPVAAPGRGSRGRESAPRGSPGRGEARSRPAPGSRSALGEGLRASPSDLPAQAPCGVGCAHRDSREHGRSLPRLRVRPFPAHVPIPAGTTASADFSAARACLPAAPSLATRRSRWPGIPGHPRRPPRIRAAPFPAHPPRLRCGPLMTAGFAVRCRLARAAPPPTRFVSLGSRVRLRLPSHPTSR